MSAWAIEHDIFLAASADIWQSDYHRVGGWQVGGRTGGRKRRWANQLILELESRNLAGIYPIHSSLFVPNFITKFGSEDLQSQGRVRPPHRKRHFRADAAIPAITAGLLVDTAVELPIFLAAYTWDSNECLATPPTTFFIKPMASYGLMIIETLNLKIFRSEFGHDTNKLSRVSWFAHRRFLPPIRPAAHPPGGNYSLTHSADMAKKNLSFMTLTEASPQTCYF